MSDEKREPREERFDAYCERNRIQEDATPAKWFIAREAFKEGYEAGRASRYETDRSEEAIDDFFARKNREALTPNLG